MAESVTVVVYEKKKTSKPIELASSNLQGITPPV